MFKYMAGLFLLLVVIIFGALAYFGFVQGFSDILGTNKPRDLEVEYTKEDYNNYIDKVHSEYIFEEPEEDMTPGESIKFDGEVNLNTTLTQEEITARVNNTEWQYIPFSNIQVRIPSPGVIEISASLDLRKLPDFFAAVGVDNVSLDQVSKGLGKLGVITKNPPIYVKANAKVTNNLANIVLQEAEIGRIPIPLDKVHGNEAINGLVNRIFSQIPGFYAEEATFEDGAMQFKGAAPTIIKLYQTE